MKQILLLFLTLFLFINFAKSSDVKLTIEDYNNWGWESLVIQNGYIELVIVPEIGGRVMRYAMPGDQQMAINERTIGKTYDPATNNNGPWGEGWGYGGYKNWPSPQSFWNWPPPSRLDWGKYSYTIEHQSADSVVVFLESEVETVRAKGYQQARRFTIYKNSTVVKVEQYLTNVSGTVRDLGIWDITQAIVQHGTENDYQNFSVYFATEKNIINDKKIDIQEVDEGIFRYQDTPRANKGDGKAYMNVSAGWCANVDERDVQSYYKLFEIFPEENHPDNNTNFQIYSAGNNSYIEIEVLSPLKKLNQSETMRYDEYWSAANVNGLTLFANKAGSIHQFTIDNSVNTFGGLFGLFNSGKVQMHYYDKDHKELGTSNEITVEAAQLLIISETIPAGTEVVNLNAYDLKNNLTGIISTAKEHSVGIEKINQTQRLTVYPGIGSNGEQFTLSTTKPIMESDQLMVIGLNGQSVKVQNQNLLNSHQISFSIEGVSPGLYLVQLCTRQAIVQQKIVIR